MFWAVSTFLTSGRRATAEVEAEALCFNLPAGCNRNDLTLAIFDSDVKLLDGWRWACYSEANANYQAGVDILSDRGNDVIIQLTDGEFTGRTHGFDVKKTNPVIDRAERMAYNCKLNLDYNNLSLKLVDSQQVLEEGWYWAYASDVVQNMKQAQHLLQYLDVTIELEDGYFQGPGNQFRVESQAVVERYPLKMAYSKLGGLCANVLKEFSRYESVKGHFHDKPPLTYGWFFASTLDLTDPTVAKNLMKGRSDWDILQLEDGELGGSGYKYAVKVTNPVIDRATKVIYKCHD